MSSTSCRRSSSVRTTLITITTDFLHSTDKVALSAVLGVKDGSPGPISRISRIGSPVHGHIGLQFQVPRVGVLFVTHSRKLSNVPWFQLPCSWYSVLSILAPQPNASREDATIRKLVCRRYLDDTSPPHSHVLNERISERGAKLEKRDGRDSWRTKNLNQYWPTQAVPQ